MGEEPGSRTPGEPEVGVKVSIEDWHKRAMHDIFLPILQRSSGIMDRDDAEWLWQQVPEAVNAIVREEPK
jgi:hypothetical protein